MVPEGLERPAFPHSTLQLLLLLMVFWSFIVLIRGMSNSGKLSGEQINMDPQNESSKPTQTTERW